MEQLELPAITTFDDARAAIAAFDARYWKHAPGLPTVRHTMIHLCISLDKGVYFDSDRKGVSLIALSGLAFEHALRLANTVSVPALDLDEWLDAQLPLRVEYVESPGRFVLSARGIHADLNSVVHDMEEGVDAEGAGMHLVKVVMSLFRLGLLSRQYAHGKAVMTPAQRWGSLVARLSYLYGEHDIDVTFRDPASS